MVERHRQRSLNMCGVLLVDSVQQIAPDRIARAESYLRRRGPNFLRRWSRGRISIWHSVLHITGNPDYYHRDLEDFCAFAGEIYNYQELGYDSDAWCVHETVRCRLGHLRQQKGPSSWIYSTGEFVCYASDPQGERHLYRYQDPDITIVASEIGIIAELVDLDTQPSQYRNKGWNILQETPYRNVERLDSGRLYINHEPAQLIDSIFDWCQPVRYATLSMAVEEFAMLWRRVIASMTPNESTTVSFSGGIDSSLIAALLPESDLLALDMQGKDPNIEKLEQVLSQDELMRLNCMSVSPEYYAAACLDMIKHTRMPPQSWSHVSKWLVAKHAGNRVLFSGAGADELFGGYECYRNIAYDRDASQSPYSSDHDSSVWRKCLSAYDNDPRPATLLLDFVYQIVSCDSQGLDRAAGAWSRETRNPFMHPDIMKFALSLPWDMRVAQKTKPVLKQYWRRLFPDRPLWSKQGFAGHANDSQPWLGIDDPRSGDRIKDWQQMAQALFYQTVTSPQHPKTTQQ